MSHQYQPVGKVTRWETSDVIVMLTLKAPITTAADDKFCDIFPIFKKNKV